MNLTDLEEPIQTIVTIVNNIDEPYRAKCFEILLEFYLKNNFKAEVQTIIPETSEEQPESVEEIIMPIDVRAFLQQYDIPEETVRDLFLITKDDIRPIYIIKTTTKSTAQIQTTLLTALENAINIKSNKFEFSIEDIRNRCKKRRIYDAANFKANFKNNAKLFKSLDDEEHVELTPEGYTELADAITTVAKK